MTSSGTKRKRQNIKSKMISEVLASASVSPQALSSPLAKPRTGSYCSAPSSTSVSLQRPCLSLLKLKSLGFCGAKGSQRSGVLCNSTAGPGGSGLGDGDGDSRSVVDAFFLGKALAEAINDRIESTVGEFLSTIGRLQAEQQKLVEDFQEDVLERAKKAKEKAAREAAKSQGITKPSEYTSPVTITNGVASATTTNTTVTPVNPSSSSEPAPSTSKSELDPANEDTVLGVSVDDD